MAGTWPTGTNSMLQGFNHGQSRQLMQVTNLAAALGDHAGTSLLMNNMQMPAPAPNPQKVDPTGLLQLLSLSLGQAQQQPPAASHDQLLQRILNLVDEYLNASNGFQGTNDPMCVTLRILKLQGDKYKQEKEQSSVAARDPLSVLRNQLLASTNNSIPSSASNNDAVRVLQAQQLFQSASVAAQRSQAPDAPPSTAAMSSSSQDTFSHELTLSEQASLLRIMACNGVQPNNPPPQQQTPEEACLRLLACNGIQANNPAQRQPEPEVPSNTIVQLFRLLQQNPQNNENR